MKIPNIKLHQICILSGMSERYLSNCAKVVADAATETIRDHILFLGEYLEKLENVYSAITNRPSMTWLLLSLPF